MKIRFSNSAIIVLFGLIGLMVGLIGNFPTLIKSIVLIVCIGLILFGMLIETPLLSHMNTPPEGQTSFDDS